MIVDGEVKIYPGVTVGAGTLIQHGVYIPPGVKIGNNVFIGPHVVFTNDKYPKANNPNFKPLQTIVEDDVNIGANATILPGLRLKRGCTIGAGAVVTKDVEEKKVVFGNPAR